LIKRGLKIKKKSLTNRGGGGRDSGERHNQPLMQLCRHPPIRWSRETLGVFGSAFLINFFKNLSVGRIRLWRESEYRENYVRRNLKMSIGSRI
jgi:hypothetical protein